MAVHLVQFLSAPAFKCLLCIVDDLTRGKHQKKKNPVSAQTGNHIIYMQTLNDLDLVDGPNMIPPQMPNPHISKGIQKLIFSLEIKHKIYIT